MTYLSALLEGTALTLFHSLSDTEDGTVTYEQLKSVLLKKFQCTPEGFRKRFRESKPTAGEPFETYAAKLRRLADRWISLSKVEKIYEGLLGLILSKQLLQSISHDLATFLCEKDERSFQNLIKSAESYRHAHPNKNLARRSDLLTYAHRSQWSIGHQRPPAIALCSGLLLSFRTSWSPAVSALLQCLASNCCEAGLSSSSPAGSRSGLGVWCWMLAS